METESVEVAVVCLPPFMSGVFEGNRKGNKLQLSEGYCVLVCMSVSCYLCFCVCIQCARGRRCETQRCGVILLFTVSIRSNFLYPLPCSARLPSHSPSSTTPSSAFTTINLGHENACGCGERKRLQQSAMRVSQPSVVDLQPGVLQALAAYCNY